MPKREEIIEQEISEVWYCLLQAKSSFDYAEYLFNPETQQEKDYMLSGVEFQFFRNILWKYSIIEISKLFKKSEKRSIPKLINKLRPGSELNVPTITQEIITKWDIQIDKLKQLIENVITMRDTVFAHNDLNYHDSLKYNAFLGDIEKLIVLTQDFISDVFLYALDGSVIHSEKFHNKEFTILKILADHEEKRREKILDKFKEYAKKSNENHR